MLATGVEYKRVRAAETTFNPVGRILRVSITCNWIMSVRATKAERSRARQRVLRLVNDGLDGEAVKTKLKALNTAAHPDRGLDISWTLRCTHSDQVIAREILKILSSVQDTIKTEYEEDQAAGARGSGVALKGVDLRSELWRVHSVGQEGVI